MNDDVFDDWWRKKYSMADLARGAAEDAWYEAVLVERERCAKIAETFWNHGGPSHKLVQKQADAIRRGTP